MERYSGISGIFAVVSLAFSLLCFTVLTYVSKWVPLLMGAIYFLIALFCFIFYKIIRKHCTVPTTLLSLGISGAGMAGLVCFCYWFIVCSFGEAYRHPILHPCSVGFGMLSLFLVILFIILYAVFRQKQWSVKGLFLDLATTMLFAPAFLMLEFFIVAWLCLIH